MNYSEIVINGIIETQNAQNDYGVFVKYMISNYDKANKEYQTLDSFFIGCLNVYDDMIRDIENQFFESQKDLKGMIKDIKDDLKIKKYPDELHKEAKEIELNFATKQLESLNYDGFSFSVSHYTANKHRGYLKMDAIVYLKTRTVELYETLKKQTENPTTPNNQQSDKDEEEKNIPIVTTIDSEKWNTDKIYSEFNDFLFKCNKDVFNDWFVKGVYNPNKREIKNFRQLYKLLQLIVIDPKKAKMKYFVTVFDKEYKSNEVQNINFDVQYKTKLSLCKK